VVSYHRVLASKANRQFRPQKITKIQMIDITDSIKECASSLSFENPFIKVESFSLLDSMAALELMDPKMDCYEASMQDKGNDIQGENINNSACTLSKLPWQELTFKDARVLAVEALVRFEAYLDAANVAESTYSCMYMQDATLREMQQNLREKGILPIKYDNNLKIGKTLNSEQVCQLSVFITSLSMVKLAEKVRNVIQNADVYEEEDFSPNAYSFLFFPSVSESNTVALLDLVLLKLQVFRDQEKDENLLSILRIHGYVKNLFQSCCSLSKITSQNVRDIATTVRKMAKLGYTQLDQLKQMSFLQKCNTSSINNSVNSTSRCIQDTFDQLLNRHLLGNAPIRKIQFKEPIKAISNLASIMNEFSSYICDVLLNSNDLHKLKRAFALISISSVNILTRSLIILNLYFDNLILGQYSLPHLISHSMQQLCGTPSPFLHTKVTISFFNRLGKPIYDMMKVLLLNRNRQRTFIDTIILKEWASLQNEANKLDFYLRQHLQLSPTNTPLFMTNFVLMHTVWVMEHYISLSIELGLWNGGHDYSVVFWYRDFLLSTQSKVLTSMQNTKIERLAIEAELQEQIGNSRINPSTFNNDVNATKKGIDESTENNQIKQQSKEQEQIQSHPTSDTLTLRETLSIYVQDDKQISLELMILTLRRNLCRGIVRFIAALHQSGMISTPSYRFTSISKRFEKRFEIFGCNENGTGLPQPPLLQYSDYLQGSDFTSVLPMDLISSASDCFKSSKSIIDRIMVELESYEDENHLCAPIHKEEVMKLAKICVGNSLFLHKFRQHIAPFDKKNIDSYEMKGNVTFDFEVHPQFCSIKIDFLQT